MEGREAAERGARPRAHHRRTGASALRTEAGDTLVEVLVSAVLLSLLAIIVMSGFAVAARSDGVQRASSANTVAVRNAESALVATDYHRCGAPSDYVGAFTAPSGSTFTINQVAYWTAASNPATFSVRSCDTAAAQGAAGGDTGLQQVTFTVRTTWAGRSVTRTRTVVKRFNGAYKEPRPDPTPGGGTCTISNASQVDSTWVNEFLGRTGDNHAGDGSMYILYLAGSRRYSYLRFNVAAGATCDEGGTLPATADIKSATVRLYTYDIGGLPACGANSCWHVMERVRGGWNVNTINWGNQPCPTGYGQSCEPGDAASPILFEHGTGALDWSARYQYVENPRLLSDVRGFMSGSLANNGWVIKEACAVTYGKACGDISPGFEMRSRYGAVSERPALILVYV